MEIATEIVAEIRARIKATTGLTASGGISYNKVSWQRWHPTRISRTASSSSRRRTVRPSSSNCPSRSSTASGWRLPKDATARDRDGSGPQGENLDFLVEHFGKSGPYFYGIARGIDNRLVKSDRARKSVGAEDTFSQDIHAFEPAREGLQPLIEKVWDYCRANEIGAKTVTLRSNMPTSARSPAAKPFRHLCWRSPILSRWSICFLRHSPRRDKAYTCLACRCLPLGGGALQRRRNCGWRFGRQALA